MAKIPLDDIIKGVLKALKGGKKPASVTETLKYSVPPKVTFSGGPPPMRPTRVKIDASKNYSSRTYDKGSPEYKAVLKKQTKDASIMKKVNKPRKQGQYERASYQADYDMALKAEKHLKSVKYSIQESPFKSDAEARKFLANHMSKTNTKKKNFK